MDDGVDIAGCGALRIDSNLKNDSLVEEEALVHERDVHNRDQVVKADNNFPLVVAVHASFDEDTHDLHVRVASWSVRVVAVSYWKNLDDDDDDDKKGVAEEVHHS